MCKNRITDEKNLALKIMKQNDCWMELFILIDSFGFDDEVDKIQINKLKNNII